MITVIFYEGYLNVKTKLALSNNNVQRTKKKGPHFNVLWTLIDNVRATKQNPTVNIHERYGNVKLLAGLYHLLRVKGREGGLSRVSIKQADSGSQILHDQKALTLSFISILLQKEL